jgi:hypothetical protein
MSYELSVIGLGVLTACFVGCGRTELDGPFSAASTISITTGSAANDQSTGAAGAGSVTGDGGVGVAGVGGTNEGGQAGGLAGSGGSAETGGVGGLAGGAGQGGGLAGTGAPLTGAAGQAGSAGAAGGSQGGMGGGLALNTLCDPIAQNCAAGLRCDLPDAGPLAFACIVDAGGSGGEGQVCQDSSQDCAKGSTCVQPVGRMGRPVGPATCFVFCNTAAECPSGNDCFGVGIFNDGGSRLRTGICQQPANN